MATWNRRRLIRVTVRTGLSSVGRSLVGVRWPVSQHRPPDTNQRFTDAKLHTRQLVGCRLFQLTLNNFSFQIRSLLKGEILRYNTLVIGDSIAQKNPNVKFIISAVLPRLKNCVLPFQLEFNEVSIAASINRYTL